LTIRPYEYPELLEYVDAIRNSYRVHSEYSYSSDIQDYHTISEEYKEIFIRTMLAISQIEVAVKSFWGDIHHILPKPEIAKVWATFSESEARHEDLYAHILDILWLQDRFDTLLEVEPIKKRLDVIESIMKDKDTDFVKKLVFFTLFIENVSLFSQFYIAMSYNKFKGYFKWMSNGVEASTKEECYIDWTEVLTPTGWVDMKDINIGDDIYQYRNWLYKLVKVLNTTSQYYKWIVHHRHNDNHNGIVTPDHLMVYKEWRKVKKGTSKTVSYLRTKATLPSCWQLYGGRGHYLLPDDKLRIILLKCFKYDNKKKAYVYTVEIEDEGLREWVDWEIQTVMAELPDIRYERIINKDWNPEHTIFCDYDKDTISDMTWLDFTNKSYVRCAKLYKYAWLLDVNKCNELAQSRLDQADMFAQSPLESIAFERYETDWIEYEWNVRCVTVPSGIIPTRLNWKTFIAGNCIHATFWTHIVNIIRREYPDKIDEEFEKDILKLCNEWLKAEYDIVDWIFEKWDIDFLKKDIIKKYISNRMYIWLWSIGIEPDFEYHKIDEDVSWFEDEIQITKHTDFFNKRSINYTKKNKSFTSEELF